MKEKFIKNKLGSVVFYWLVLTLRIKATFLVSNERPCPMERVTFTCTAPGDLMRWSLSDAPNINLNPDFIALNTPLMPITGYTVTLIAFNDTSLTSTLSRIAVNGVMVTCLDPPTNLIGAATIQLAGPPSSPQGASHSVESNSVNEVSVSVQWNPPTETGGRDDLTYTVTVSPPALLSATVLTSTSVTVTAQYNVDYTVSVVATNCAGNSTTAEYNFRIGCPVLINPMNGAYDLVSNRLPGSTVTIQCDAGYVSAIVEVMCEEGTLMWSPDPETIMCVSITTPPPTNQPTLNCTAPLSSLQNGAISEHSIPAIPGTRVTFQCDSGLFPEGIMTTTCMVDGEWDQNPGEIVCRNESISCILPAPPLNGNTNSQNTNPIEGSVITFQCDPGFSLVGAATATCNNSGLWDPNPALVECVFLPYILSSAAIVSVSVIVTAVVFTVIGLLIGIMATFLVMRKKVVSAKGQANVGPSVPPGPVYEEVLPKEEIELNTNQAYEPV